MTGEVTDEQRGYDRAIAEVVAWLRTVGGKLLRTGSAADKIAGAEMLMRADAIEAGEHKP